MKTMQLSLTHRGRVTHICGNQPVLSPVRHYLNQRRFIVNWTLVKKISENWVKIQKCKEINLKMSSAKWQYFWLDLNVFKFDTRSGTVVSWLYTTALKKHIPYLITNCFHGWLIKTPSAIHLYRMRSSKTFIPHKPTMSKTKRSWCFEKNKNLMRSSNGAPLLWNVVQFSIVEAAPHHILFYDGECAVPGLNVTSCFLWFTNCVLLYDK